MYTELGICFFGVYKESNVYSCKVQGSGFALVLRTAEESVGHVMADVEVRSLLTRGISTECLSSLMRPSTELIAIVPL